MLLRKWKRKAIWFLISFSFKFVKNHFETEDDNLAMRQTHKTSSSIHINSVFQNSNRLFSIDHWKVFLFWFVFYGWSNILTKTAFITNNLNLLQIFSLSSIDRMCKLLRKYLTSSYRFLSIHKNLLLDKMNLNLETIPFVSILLTSEPICLLIWICNTFYNSHWDPHLNRERQTIRKIYTRWSRKICSLELVSELLNLYFRNLSFGFTKHFQPDQIFYRVSQNRIGFKIFDNYKFSCLYKAL